MSIASIPSVASLVPGAAPAGMIACDLSPIVLRDVPTSNGVLRFREPLVLLPTQLEDSSCFSLEYPELGIDVYGETREEMLSMLDADILDLWYNIALADDARLGAAFRRVKKSLLVAVEEVHYD